MSERDSNSYVLALLIIGGVSVSVGVVQYRAERQYHGPRAGGAQNWHLTNP